MNEVFSDHKRRVPAAKCLEWEMWIVQVLKGKIYRVHWYDAAATKEDLLFLLEKVAIDPDVYPTVDRSLFKAGGTVPQTRGIDETSFWGQ